VEEVCVYTLFWGAIEAKHVAALARVDWLPKLLHTAIKQEFPGNMKIFTGDLRKYPGNFRSKSINRNTHMYIQVEGLIDLMYVLKWKTFMLFKM